MDEPFSALDMDIRQAMIPELKQLLQKFDITSLIVTHNPQELEGIADNTIHIQ